MTECVLIFSQIRGNPGEYDTRDAIQVLESVEKYAVLSCVEGGREIQDC